jgi:DNA-binding PadR family transcriptional regulator
MNGCRELEEHRLWERGAVFVAHHHGRRHGRFGPWVGPERFFAMGGPGPFAGWGPKVGRGRVREAILSLLAEEPMHGYQIMQELAERSHGVWQPSPGSIYPTLQQLEDEGLVRAEESEGRRVYQLTEEGRRHVESRSERGTPPWEAASGAVGSALFELRDLAFQVGAAVMQVARAGSEEQVERAKQILAETRRQIYRLLAEGDA